MKAELKSLEKDLEEYINDAKSNYFSEQFEKYKNNVKKTWETIKLAINKRRQKPSYPQFFQCNGKNIFERTEIANEFNKYFTGIGPELAESLDITGKPCFKSFMGEQATSRFSFKRVECNTITKLIDNLPAKSSAGPDGISSIVLKEIKDVIVPILTIAINQSLSSGVFPSNLKVAQVIPLFKNKGEPFCFGNYRPISLLNVISKIYERVVYNQLYEYFVTNNLFYKSQYGFRTQHSTEDAAIELIDQVHHIFENDAYDQVLAVFLDLSKAFDTIDHDILIYKLKHYGIDGEPLRWLLSYLTDRKQYIKLEDVTSDLMDISVGVPQGSILGPLLFLIYINDVCRASSVLDFIHFADDTTLSKNLAFFGLSGTLSPEQSQRRINVELKKVYDWLCVNKLSLNVSKTRSMVFKNPKLPTVSLPFDIEINGEKVKNVSEFNFLGIMLDEFLTWTPHTKKVTSSVSRSLGVIKRVRSFLPIPVLKTLYSTLILPHLTYGLKLWGVNRKPIEMLQKRAVRVITLSKYFAHTSPLFKKHSLLKLEDIYKIQCLKLHYKIERGVVPEFFRSFTIHNWNIHDHFTRGRNDLRPTKVKSNWLRHFLPRLVLETPGELLANLHSTTINTFSKNLKKYYIDSYTTACTRHQCLPCGRNVLL